MDVRLRPWNLSASQGAALAVLGAHGPQRMSDLARYLLQQTQTTTDLVDRLEARGLVQRVRHPSDRRVVLVEATEAAHNLLNENWEVSWELMRETFGLLSDKDLKTLTDTAKKVRNRAAEIGGIPAEHLAYAEERLRLTPDSLATPTAAD